MGNLSNDFIYSMPDSAAEPIYAYPQKFVVRVLGPFVEPVDKLDSPRDQSLDSQDHIVEHRCRKQTFVSSYFVSSNRGLKIRGGAGILPSTVVAVLD